MLRDIKQKSSGLGAKIIMGLLIIAFGFWGISGSLISSNNDSAATVNGSKISINDFNQANQASKSRLKKQFGDNLGSDYFDSINFKKGVMNQLVDSELLKQEAEKFDYDVSPSQIRDYIQSSPGLQIEGKFSKEAYANFLAQVNKSAELLQRDIKDDLKSTALPSLITQSAFALSDEVDNQIKLEKQKRSFDYVELSSNDYKDKVVVTEDEINDHYKEFSNDYKTTEQVSVNYIELSIEDLIESIEVSDEELQTYYDAKKKTLKTAEKRKAQHILLQVKDNKEEIKIKIDEIANKLKTGSNFEELAKEFSEDPGSAPNGGDLDWVTKGDMVKEFEEKLFSMTAGEISEPVLSSFGYHIIKLNEVKSPEIPQLDDIKMELTKDLKKEKADDEFLRVADELETFIIDSDNVLELAAENAGLTVLSTPLFAKGRGKEIAAKPNFSKVAFSDVIINDNETSEMIDLGENHIAYLHINEHKQPEVKPLEEIKSVIESKLKATKAQDLAKETAQNYLKELESDKTTLADIAKDLSKTVVEAKDIERTGSKQPYNLVKNVFALSKDTKVTFVESNANAYALLKLNAITDADVSKSTKDDKSKIINQLERSTSNNEIINMTKYLRSESSITINEKIYEDAQ